MRLPRLVLRVLSPSPCMAVDTHTVPSWMDAVERYRDRGGSGKLLLDGESGLTTTRHYHWKQIGTTAPIEGIEFFGDLVS